MEQNQTPELSAAPKNPQAPQKRPAGQPPRKPANGRPPQNGKPAPNGQPRKPAGGRPPQDGKPAPNGQPNRKPLAERPAQEGRPAPNGQPRKPAGSRPPQAGKPAPNGQPPRKPAGERPAQNGKPAPNGQPNRRPVPPASQRHPAQPGNRPPQRPNGQAPQGRRPVQPGARPADGQRRPPQRPPQDAPTKRAPQPRNGAPKRTVNRFRVGMAIYISLAFIITLWGCRRLWLFLDEYEQSRPEHTIENYTAHISSDFYSQMISESVKDNPLTKYETPETILSTLDTGSDSQTYSWGKKADEYTDDKPVYFIRYGGAAIASVGLTREGSTEKFDFPVWKVDDTPSSLIEISSEPQYSVNITLPSNTQLTVNGIAVALQEMTSCDAPLVLDETELEYVDQPQAMQVEIDGLYASPVIQVSDLNGNVLEPETAPDEHDKKQTYVYLPADEQTPDAAMIARVESMTIAYKNYMINEGELNETGANLAALRQFLLGNSKAMQMMNAMSGEVYWNNPYTSREDKVLEVEHIKMYSPDLCTCESHLDYVLTKVSDRGTVTNEYDIRIIWTMVRVNDVWYASNMVLNQVENPDADNPAEDAPAEENEPA